MTWSLDFLANLVVVRYYNNMRNQVKYIYIGELYFKRQRAGMDDVIIVEIDH